MAAERVMAWRTDLLLFESAFIAQRYADLVGPPRGLSRVIRNGIGDHEFQKVRPRPDAAEFLYVGELRAAKGIDTLIDALAAAGDRMAKPPRAILVGSGADKQALLAHAARRGLQDRIEFAGVLPARQAFERGRILVVPSRAESLPYIVLEAAGACIPMIATAVGGIPEIFGPYRDRLIAADDPARLADRMIEMITASEAHRAAAADDLARHVRQCFSVETMVEDVIEAYRHALSRRAEGAPAAPHRVALSS
jgi:glycosyltransferase involved in cell wall biosynthesis